MRNNKLQFLNLALNDLGESFKEVIERLAKGASDTFSLILNFNQFEEKTKENWKKNFKKTI